MPQALRKVGKLEFSKLPVSYKTNPQDRMLDALNVVTIDNVLETKPGTSRYNAIALHATKQINSITYFKDKNEVIRVLAKVQEDMYLVSESAAHTLLKGGFIVDEDVVDEDIIADDAAAFSADNKHRAVTIRGRHIIAAGSDGLFSYDGTTFSQLGQAVPSAPTVAKSGAGNTLPTATYEVAVTFYDSTNGFETNIGASSSQIAITLGEQIDVSNIANSADNANIDSIRVYLKDVTNAGEFLFWDEISLGTTTDTIDAEPSSSNNPPTKNAPPIAGGAKHIVIFDGKVVYTGNSTFPSDTFFGTEDIPDAFDDTATGLRLFSQGNGPNTGLGVGFYNNDEKKPFLCIFKRTSFEVYDNDTGLSLISKDVGAPSGDTVKEINGSIFFQSTIGWHVIINGKLVRDKNNDSYVLADGDMNAIFNRDGYVHALAKNQLKNAFSVYYPTLDQYLTFNALSGSNEFKRSINYELNISGFRPYLFPQKILDAELAEDSSGEDIVLLASEDGFILKHSVKESRSDVLADGSLQAINCFGLLYWLRGFDLDATYNYGNLNILALQGDTAVEFKFFLNYSFQLPDNQDFDFSSSETGFIVDVSKVDEGILSDGRSIVRYRGGVYRTAQSLLIGFYQNTINKNINLIEGQIDFNKNGNVNI